MKNRKSKGLTPREKAAAALAVAGMCLTATDSLTAAIAGTALLGAGAVVLNWEEIQEKLRKIGSQCLRGATRSRQPKPVAGMSAAASCPPAVTRAKKKAARKPERHTKNYTTTSYQKEEGMSSHV